MTSRKLAIHVCLCLFFSVAALSVAGEEKPAKETGKTDAAKSKISVKIVDWEESLKLVGEELPGINPIGRKK